MQQETIPPYMNGLQKAIVLQLQNDPLGEYRILIKIGTATTAVPVWATLACWDAGNKRGSFFLPEIGDEVIVGYINNDPREPVILGSFYSKKSPPVIEPTDMNPVKKYTSRSGTEITIDDEDKMLMLKTPAGNLVILDEKEKKLEIRDQSNNRITFSTSGLILESISTIQIKSATDLVLDAAGTITLKGQSVLCKATTELRTESQNASFKTAGVTEIKGALIKIN